MFDDLFDDIFPIEQNIVTSYDMSAVEVWGVDNHWDTGVDSKIWQNERPDTVWVN
jgi:hypothetical protein